MATKKRQLNKEGGAKLTKVRRVVAVEKEDQINPGLFISDEKKKEDDDKNDNDLNLLPVQLVSPKDRYEIERTLIIKGIRGAVRITEELNKMGIKIAIAQVSRDLHEVNKLFAAEHEKFKKHWDVGVHLQTRLDDLKRRRDRISERMDNPKISDFSLSMFTRMMNELDEIEAKLYAQCGMDMAPPVAKAQQVTIHYRGEPKGGWPDKQQAKS